MLAPSGRKLPQLMVEQARALGQVSAVQLTDLEQQAGEISAHKMPPAQTFFGVPAAFYYDLAARDEVAIARSLDVPILILRGARDYQAGGEDLRDWQTGLKGDPKVRAETMPSLNHLFIAGTGAGTPGPAEYFAPGHVDVALIGRSQASSQTPAARRRRKRRRIESLRHHRRRRQRRPPRLGCAQGLRQARQPHDALMVARHRPPGEFDRRSCDRNSRRIRGCARAEVAAVGLAMPVKITPGGIERHVAVESRLDSPVRKAICDRA